MPGLGQRLKGILRQRCPLCLKGDVFRGAITMRKCCPECGHHFEREPGYFLGAMYASYFLAIPILGLLTLAFWLLLPDWLPENVVLIAALPFLFLIPLVFRYARIIWMHIDAPPGK